MPIQTGKIVVLGAVLTAASFLAGLLQSNLPAICLGIVESGIAFMVFFCFGVFGVISVFLASAVFAIACLFMNPIGVFFMLAMLWLALNRKTSLPH